MDRGYILVSCGGNEEMFSVINQVYLASGKTIVASITDRDEGVYMNEFYERILGIQKDDKILEPIVVSDADPLRLLMNFHNHIVDEVLSKNVGNIEFIIACSKPEILVPVLLEMLLNWRYNMPDYVPNALLRVPHIKRYKVGGSVTELPGTVGRVLHLILSDLGALSDDLVMLHPSHFKKFKGSPLVGRRRTFGTTTNLFDIMTGKAVGKLESRLLPKVLEGEFVESSKEMLNDLVRVEVPRVDPEPISAALGLAYGLLHRGVCVGDLCVGSLRLPLRELREYAPPMSCLLAGEMSMSQLKQVTGIKKALYSYMRKLEIHNFVTSRKMERAGRGRRERAFELTASGKVLARILAKYFHTSFSRS